MRKKHDRTRKIGFEHLENRAMMAGNVSAAVEGGDLVIRGTTHDNFVLVTRFNDGTVKVAGVPGTNTRINGQSSVKFSEVTGSLFANLGSGNDGIAILKGTFSGEIDIRTGRGIDGVLITKTNAVGFNILTGADTDVVVLAGVNAFIPNTEGPSTAQVAGGFVNIETGNGKDFVLLAKVNAFGIDVLTGSDTDAVGMLSVFCNVLNVGMGTGNFDALAVAKSGAEFANFQGGDESLDIHIYARNSFQEQTVEGFEFKQSFDAYVDQVENFIKLAQPYLKQLPSIRNLPEFNL